MANKPHPTDVDRPYRLEDHPYGPPGLGDSEAKSWTGTETFTPQGTSASGKGASKFTPPTWNELRGLTPEELPIAAVFPEVLDLGPLSHRSFATLSGGERQRALLAQGLARGADLLLVDEPTTGLDTRNAAHICEAVAREVARGVCVVCVSHDPDVIARADRAVRLEEGRVVADDGAGQPHYPAAPS